MALEEAEAWAAFAGVKDKGGIGPSLSTVLKRPSSAIRYRHELYLAGSAATPLWECIEKGMPLRSAIRILRTARRRAEIRKSPLNDAVVSEIRFYESFPGRTFVTRDGRVVKRKSQGQDPDQDQPESEPPTPEPKDRPVKPRPPRSRPSRTSPPEVGQTEPQVRGNPWSRIREAVNAVSVSMVKDLDPDVAARLLTEVDVEMRRVVTWLKSRVYLSSKSASEKQLISRPRKEIVTWCHTLNIDPPRVGKPVDHDVLRRQFRILSLAYHPDRNPGRPEMEEKQRAVNSAYDGLIAYNEWIKED